MGVSCILIVDLVVLKEITNLTFRPDFIAVFFLYHFYIYNDDSCSLVATRTDDHLVIIQNKHISSDTSQVALSQYLVDYETC